MRCLVWALQWGCPDTWLGATLNSLPDVTGLVPPLILAALAVRSRTWVAVGAGAVGLVGVVLTMSYATAPESTPAGPNDIRLVSLNIAGGIMGIDHIHALLTDQHADILCLQEMPDTMPPNLLPSGTDWHVVRQQELAIASRYPIIESKLVNLGGPVWRPALEAVLDINGVRTTVIDVHYLLFFNGIQIFYNPVLWMRLPMAYALRQVQTQSLLDLAAQAHTPLVIAGDFNAPRAEHQVQRMSAVYRDAFKDAGHGFGYTFDSRCPVLGIDYVFTSPDIGAVACTPLPPVVSDHRGLSATLSLRHQ